METLAFVVRLLMAFVEPADGVYDVDAIDLEFLDCKPWHVVQEVNDSTWRTYTPNDTAVVINVYVNEEETSKYELPIEYTNELVYMLKHADYNPE